jgi:hypothetical protein
MGDLAADRTQPSTRVAGLLWARTRQISSAKIPAFKEFARRLHHRPRMATKCDGEIYFKTR